MAPRSGPVAGTYPISTGTCELIPDRFAGGWLLTVNGAHSSHLDPDDPLLLDFDYMRQIAAVVENRFVATAPPRVLHLGAAACSLPRYLAARLPGARQVAVEVDAELARLVREWFDLPRAPRLRIRVGDAREVTASLTEHTRDIVIRDAFSGSRSPRHLTTVEFVGQVRRVLAPGGLYFANCGDDRNRGLVRSEAATIAAVFDHLALIADPAMLKGRRSGNVVLVGSDAPIDADPALVRALLSDPLPSRLLTGADARAFASGSVIRDDDDAPIAPAR